MRRCANMFKHLALLRAIRLRGKLINSPTLPPKPWREAMCTRFQALGVTEGHKWPRESRQYHGMAAESLHPRQVYQYYNIAAKSWYGATCRHIQVFDVNGVRASPRQSDQRDNLAAKSWPAAMCRHMQMLDVTDVYAPPRQYSSCSSSP